MVTLCTSTCYCGCDFYSTCATTFVISDCHRSNTAVDISTELTQICGRQRLAENPFRNEVFFIYNVWGGDGPLPDKIEKLNWKMRKSEAECEWFNNAPKDLLGHLRQMVKTDKTLNQDKHTYTFYNDETQQFELNRMSILSDRYQLFVQHDVYNNSIFVFRNLEAEEMFSVSENVQLQTVTEHVKNTITKTTFQELMKTYCGYQQAKRGNPLDFNLMLADMESQHPQLKIYYDLLGETRIRALGYKEKPIKDELFARQSDTAIRLALRQTFSEEREYTTGEIKNRMQAIFSRLGVKLTATKEKLQRDYGFRLIEHNRKTEWGTRMRMYEVKFNDLNL